MKGKASDNSPKYMFFWTIFQVQSWWYLIFSYLCIEIRMFEPLKSYAENEYSSSVKAQSLTFGAQMEKRARLQSGQVGDDVHQSHRIAAR